MRRLERREKLVAVRKSSNKDVAVGIRGEVVHREGHLERSNLDQRVVRLQGQDLHFAGYGTAHVDESVETFRDAVGAGEEAFCGDFAAFGITVAYASTAGDGLDMSALYFIYSQFADFTG